MTEAPRSVDYFFTPMSPWAYLGHARFVRIARETGATVRVRPVDLSQVFSVSGGLPLPKRAPQRQAYRLVDMRRFADWLGMPLNLQPAFFPVKGDPSAQLIAAVEQRDGTDAALQLTGAAMAACWAQDRDIADPATLAALLQECGLPAERLAQSQTTEVTAACQAHTQAAIDMGVFGAPSYVVDGEIFWGQDRLDFLQRKLGAI